MNKDFVSGPKDEIKSEISGLIMLSQEGRFTPLSGFAQRVRALIQLQKTLKAFANSSPGQRPGVSVKDTLRRTLKVFAPFYEPFQGSRRIISFALTQGVALGWNWRTLSALRLRFPIKPYFPVSS